ncbi:very short patch repair endonuclease [Faecalicoccus pleomorphus]|uniref:very short patch repair endonuclease n=1 Tax=Faecalicoccus pleomorphus TaxID=1323 RepID=UPI0025A4017B|nr:very short patch repair endonuclease [Faecalicoccus pleomorphus]MDM8292053.1 very short patch repair endonuclease [Faecalicoccus pleomorphus]
MDTMTKEQRHRNMSHIKSKNTSLEILVRKRLFRDGFRYRINVSNLPGKPDIVLPKYHTVIFVNGCFWHRHNCKLATMPKTHTDFWKRKFEQNVKNDLANHKKLRNLGWHVIILWECEIKEDFEQLIKVTESEMKQYYMIDSL